MKPVGLALLQHTRRKAQPQSKTRGAEERVVAREHGRQPGAGLAPPARRPHSPGI